jgi:hypothetical protein
MAYRHRNIDDASGAHTGATPSDEDLRQAAALVRMLGGGARGAFQQADGKYRQKRRSLSLDDVAGHLCGAATLAF